MSAIEGFVGARQIAVGTGSNAAVTITVNAPLNAPNLYFDGVVISASAAPAAAVEATIAGPSSTIGLQIPASPFAPIGLMLGAGPVPCVVTTQNGVKSIKNLVVTVPALGSGVVCDVCLFYHVGP